MQQNRHLSSSIKQKKHSSSSRILSDSVLMGRSMPKPFSYVIPLNGEEKLLMYLEIAVQIVYLLILIVALIVGLRKCKRNSRPNTIGGGQGQMPVSLSFTSDDGDDDNSSGQIAMDPTSLVVNATMAF